MRLRYKFLLAAKHPPMGEILDTLLMHNVLFGVRVHAAATVFARALDMSVLPRTMWLCGALGMGQAAVT